MNLPKTSHHMSITALMILFSTALSANNPGQLNLTETKEKWGQVLFCQRIYKMQEVQPRLYSFDIEQCDKAAQLMTDTTSRYSQQQQAQLKIQAERHAALLGQNTAEPYQAVTACREYCRKLADILDKSNE